MPGKSILLHRKEQKIGEIVFGVEFEVVEKEKLAVFFDNHVEVAVAHVDEDTRGGLGLQGPADKQAARMGDDGRFPFA